MSGFSLGVSEEDKRVQWCAESRVWFAASRFDSCLDAMLRAVDAEGDLQADERTMLGVAVATVLRRKTRALAVLVAELEVIGGQE